MTILNYPDPDLLLYILHFTYRHNEKFTVVSSSDLVGPFSLPNLLTVLEKCIVIVTDNNAMVLCKQID